MAMQRSTDRILTTHCGSLARPKDLLDMMKAKVHGEPYDPDAYARRVRGAVAEIVRQQVKSGIDIPSDGEQGKPGFFTYVSERLTGFAPKPDARMTLFAAEVAAFPEYYKEYFSQAMLGGAIAPMVPLVCTGPVSYRGQEAVRQDIDNLKAALAGTKPEAVFMPALAPSGVGQNEYYRSEEEYLQAVAEAMHTEYRAIVDAGFLVQIDDPFLTDVYSDPSLSAAERRKRGELYVEALNHGLRGIPAEKVRFHTCYGINEGPRVHDASLKDVVDTMLKVNAGAYSFEAANARHEHEYHLWETVKLPAGKVLIPGVVTHASNIVEHPELIAERLVRYAKLVGRENVIAGSDCGFSSQATYHPEVHPTVVWAKFQAMAEGARLATAQLWQ
jgi:5-methyltetrahydropteroyltriglutamate--homocysteine methyltransferase